MKRLLNRKGFTMVELIVVVGMIAIMLAILIPFLSTADARESEAKEYARSFYSNVQELMTDEKLARTSLPGGDTTEYILVAVRVDENFTSYDDYGVYMAYSSDSTPTFTAPVLLTDQSDVKNSDGIDVSFDPQAPYEDYGEFVTSLRKMLLGNDRDGWFYAVVDSKFRVVSAYFTYAGADSSDPSTAFPLVNGKQFTDDCRVGDNDLLTGAWPESLCVKGSEMFQLPAD